MMKKNLKKLSSLLGLEQSFVSHREKLISALGGFLSIIAITLISHAFLGHEHFWIIVPSMGASAVLLFAVPHGQLSQPWPLIGGNMISAVIGISCALTIKEPMFAMSAAVGLSILAMYYLKCIHPPGGATALIAVVATEGAHSIGYEFLLTPILLNVLTIFAIAVLFNYFFPWRRYPTFLGQDKSAAKGEETFFHHDDFLNALKEFDSFVDINEYDLKRIFALASASAHAKTLEKHDFEVGHYYSNGKIGKEWAIKKVVDEDDKKDFIIVKLVTGCDTACHESIHRKEFAKWAKYEILKENGRWHRKI